MTSSRVIEERIVALEQFIRMAIHRLTHYSTMDVHASQSLRRMQQFLGFFFLKFYFTNFYKLIPINYYSN